MSQSAVQRFYRYHALVYDYTRWMILHGRRRAAAALALKPDSRVLEVGCGTGLNFPKVLSYLHPQRGRCVGLDFSMDMLKQAKRRVASEGWTHVQVVQGDATRMVFAGKFDGILFAYSLSMIPDWLAALDRAVASLSPGGRLVVLDFGGFEKWGPLRPWMRAWLKANHVATGLPVESALRTRLPIVTMNHWLGGYNFTAVGKKE